MELFHERHPQLPQVACFDTAFHRHMPRVAKLLPLPRRLDAKGVSGLAFTAPLQILNGRAGRIAGRKAAQGRVILAHLGNGASMAAVRGGKSIDTSMGFTPAAGLPMSNSVGGEIDPGAGCSLGPHGGDTGKQFHNMVHHESGLLGVSETSPDMRDLLAREAKDVRAAEAVALFDTQGEEITVAFAAAPGGVGTLVFAGGIGENAFEVRARISRGPGIPGPAAGREEEQGWEAGNFNRVSRVTVRADPDG